jgi:serine/threonine-protein kinase HipA
MQPLPENRTDYHLNCCQSLFEQPFAPELNYRRDELGQLAKKIIRQSVTVPGVQAKLSMHIRKTRDKGTRLTLVGLWGNFILKPPTDLYAHLPENEALTMQLATLFGIETVPHGLIRLASKELAYITRRIDRTLKHKIPMEDFCQLSLRMTEHKYRGSYEQLAKIITAYCQNTLFEILKFYELILFCFLTGNADMHLKNFSLIYENHSSIRLAPAYDLLNTRLVLTEKQDPEETALTLDGKKSKFTRSNFIRFGLSIGLTNRQIDNVFQRFKSGLAPALDLVSKSFLHDSVAAKYQEIFQDRCNRLF